MTHKIIQLPTPDGVVYINTQWINMVSRHPSDPHNQSVILNDPLGNGYNISMPVEDLIGLLNRQSAS